MRAYLKEEEDNKFSGISERDFAASDKKRLERMLRKGEIRVEPWRAWWTIEDDDEVLLREDGTAKIVALNDDTNNNNDNDYHPSSVLGFRRRRRNRCRPTGLFYRLLKGLWRKYRQSKETSFAKQSPARLLYTQS